MSDVCVYVSVLEKAYNLMYVAVCVCDCEHACMYLNVSECVNNYMHVMCGYESNL